MTKTDFIVIGSGIAGLSYALKVADFGDVVIITKKGDSESSTNYAQGGIASALGTDDSMEKHVADTLATGDGLCHEDMVKIIIKEGPEVIKQLVDWGCRFTREEICLSDVRADTHEIVLFMQMTLQDVR